MARFGLLGSTTLVEAFGTKWVSVRSILSQPKRMALLAYLTLAEPRGFHRRDKLLPLFWPELDDAHARNALSSSLTALRKALGNGVIRTRGKEEVGVDPTRIRTDVEDFEQALASGDPESALHHYRGHFLDGFHLTGCHGFEEWASQERRRLLGSAAAAAWDLADQRIAAGDLTAGQRMARRALRWLPTDEGRVRAFIEALAEGGDRAAAVQFFDEFRALLLAELDLEPSAETRAVVDTLRVEPSAGAPSRASAPPRHGPRESFRSPPQSDETHGSLSPPPSGRTGSWWTKTAVAAAGAAALLLLVVRPPMSSAVREDSPRSVNWTILARVEGSATEEDRSMVEDLLSLDIDRSGIFLTLPGSQVESGLAEALQPPSAPLTLPLARQLADRGGLATVFAPTLDRVGEGVVLSLRVIHARRDSVMAAASFFAHEPEELFEGSREVVGSVVASLADWEGLPPGQWKWPTVTDSWEAFGKVRQAKRANGRGEFRLAIGYVREALKLDPDFAGAWDLMGLVYANLGHGDSARIAGREALERSDRLSEEQHLLLEARLSHDQGRTVDLLRAKYRATGVADNSLALALYRVGRWEEALAVHEAMDQQSPFPLRPLLYHNRALILMLLGRTDEADRVIEAAAGTPWYPSMKARIAVRAGDWAGAAEHAATILDRTGDAIAFRAVAYLTMASAHAGRGRIEPAYAALREGVEETARARSELHRQLHLAALLLSWTSGIDPDPWSLASLEADPSPAAAEIRALWAAHRGDPSVVRTVLEARPASDAPDPGRSTDQRARRRLLAAIVAIQDEHWDEAVDLLEPVSGNHASRADGFNALRHWVYAEAQERAGHPDSAARLYAAMAEGRNLGYLDYVAFGLIRPFADCRAALLFHRVGSTTEAARHGRECPSDDARSAPATSPGRTEGRS